jgi:hypothetical protein
MKENPMDELRRLVVLGLPLSIPALARAEAPTAEAVPATPPGSLSIGGTVKSPSILRPEELRKSSLVRDVEEIALTKRGGEVKRILRGYRGVRLTELLDSAGIDAPDHNALKRSYVVARAKDDYTVIFSWCELFNTPIGSGVHVLVDKDDLALPDSEGPLTLVSARDIFTGPRHVRWLVSLDVLRV